MKFSASIVLYNSNEDEISNIYSKILESSFPIHLYLIDNSPARQFDFSKYTEATYIFTGRNLGYGSGHNIAMRQAIELGSKFHFIMNPDIDFDPNTLTSLLDYIEKHQEIGHLMPKVVYANNELQYLCKLLPNPLNLFARRFPIPIVNKYFKKVNKQFQLEFWNYNTVEEIPALSGCFMLLRLKAVQEVGFFDEKYFMYLEDYDLTRRIGEKYQTIYFPEVSITHMHNKESFKSMKMALIHIRSAIYYFNKHGWFFDPVRKERNSRLLNKLTTPKIL